MESIFSTFLTLGFEHISDIKAYDHILFLVALCAIYRLSEWKKVLILVTAFTIGHSITLALAALNIISFSTKIVEFLIPVTILITSLFNVWKRDSGGINQTLFSKKINITYLLALFFGTIHGMGFSNFLRSTLMPGEEDSLISQLFAFNIGVELGQLMIVAIILGCAYLALNIFKVKQREWNLFVSGAAAGVALILMMDTYPF
ncbi:MAG: HupE/UreJ family protein [Saprospiraceae bacterium]